jgi:hypothetical protein
MTRTRTPRVSPVRTPRTRLAAALGAGVLLLAPLTACDAIGGTDASSAASSASSAAAGAASAASSAVGGRAAVDCSGRTCSLTLNGTDASASVLGTTVALKSTSGGSATIQVGDRQVSCTPGQSVGAGPLRLQCSKIGDGTVTLTASLG